MGTEQQPERVYVGDLCVTIAPEDLTADDGTVYTVDSFKAKLIGKYPVDLSDVDREPLKGPDELRGSFSWEYNPEWGDEKL